MIDLLEENGVVCISGNHDQAALTADVISFNPTAAKAALWTFKNLDPGSMDYLRMLPLDYSFIVGGKRVFLVHGSPDDELWEYVSEKTHADRFGAYLIQVRAQVMGVGHTHVPFIWRGPEGMVFNPGSVGQPRDHDRRACYATLTVDDAGGMEFEHRRVDYDVGTAARKIKEAGLSEELADRLFIGR